MSRINESLQKKAYLLASINSKKREADFSAPDWSPVDIL